MALGFIFRRTKCILKIAISQLLMPYIPVYYVFFILIALIFSTSFLFSVCFLFCFNFFFLFFFLCFKIKTMKYKTTKKLKKKNLKIKCVSQRVRVHLDQNEWRLAIGHLKKNTAIGAKYNKKNKDFSEKKKSLYTH